MKNYNIVIISSSGMIKIKFTYKLTTSTTTITKKWMLFSFVIERLLVANRPSSGLNLTCDKQKIALKRLWICTKRLETISCADFFKGCKTTKIKVFPLKKNTICRLIYIYFNFAFLITFVHCMSENKLHKLFCLFIIYIFGILFLHINTFLFYLTWSSLT